MAAEVSISPEVWDRLSLVIRYVESLMTSDEIADEKYRPIVRSVVFVRTSTVKTIAPYRWAGTYYELVDVYDRTLVPVWESSEGFDCDVLTIDNSIPVPGRTYIAVTIGQEVETSNPVVLLIGTTDAEDEESSSSGSSESESHIGPFVTKSWTACETDDYGNNVLVSYNERGIQYLVNGVPGPVIYYDTITI